MKKIIYSLSFFLLALTGCQVEEVDYFDDTNIYVEFSSTEFSSSFLLYPDITEMSVDIDVSIQGRALTEEREIKIVADTSSTAIEGVHYIFPEKFVFPADVYSATVPITILLTDDMDDVTYNLVMNIEDADNALRGETVQATLTIDNKISCPDWWVKSSSNVIYSNLLGTYSDYKYLYFIEVTGVSDLSDMSYADMLRLTMIYKAWLDENYPVSDASGSIITLAI